MATRGTLTRIVVAGVALIGIVVALVHLQRSHAGLSITRVMIGRTPATVFRPADDLRAPVVVIAHGFAGSQQLMQPFAITLARNGYIAVTFDFPGHGRNADALSGGLSDANAMQHDLLETVDAVASSALALPGSDGRLAVLGHSMAADIVVRYASAHRSLVTSAIAVSLFLPAQETFDPRNLLIVDGALEPAMLRDQAADIIAASIGQRPEPGVTYGGFSDGSARRVAYAGSVEHIGVLYSADSMREAVAWLDQSFDRHGSGFIDARGRWLGLLFLGVIVLAWPLSALLPRVADPDPIRALAWRWLLVVCAVPALVTPLVLSIVPTAFLPLLLGDYLACHLALFGALSGAVLWTLRARTAGASSLHADRPKFVAAVAAVTAFAALAVGLPLNAYVVSLIPTVGRLPLIAAMMLGTLPYFIADEWLTRRLAPMRGAYATSKAFFVLSLLVAIALDPERLFFLVIIVPAIVVLFVAYGLFSAWSHEQTRHPLVAALANAFVFAWFIAVTFPIVRR